MCRSSTSSSSTSWRRVRRGAVWLLLALLGIEGFLRLPPIAAWRAAHISPYERLLWSDDFLPGYQQMLDSRGYDLWLIGSSYMMTGLDPAQIAAGMPQPLRMENFGMNRMLNLETMSLMLDRWLLQHGTPRYAVLGVSVRNFIALAGDPTPAETSPYERRFIFADNLDDHLARLLYAHSALYQTALLGRSAATIPLMRVTQPAQGGYVPRVTVLDCAAALSAEARGDPTLRLAVAAGFARLDALLAVFARRGIPVLVVGIPAPACVVDFFYGGHAVYMREYVAVVEAHLSERGVPSAFLDARFQEVIPPYEQFAYFADSHHPNVEGAALFSAWTAEALAEWLAEMH